MQTLRRAAVLIVSWDHAKLVMRCHLSNDIHVILFCLVLVQNTSHRDIRSRQSKEVAMHSPFSLLLWRPLDASTGTDRGARCSPTTEAL
jgi:hypothetical protein